MYYSYSSSFVPSYSFVSRTTDKIFLE